MAVASQRTLCLGGFFTWRNAGAIIATMQSNGVMIARSFSGGCNLTNMVMNGPTNSTVPADAVTIKAWANFTNSSGGVFKMPLYQ